MPCFFLLVPGQARYQNVLIQQVLCMSQTSHACFPHPWRYTNNIPLWVMSGFIFSSYHSVMSILLKSSTRKELWFYWSIYVTVFHLIGRSKMSERLPNMTLNRVLLNVSALPNLKKKGYNKHLMTGFS